MTRIDLTQHRTALRRIPRRALLRGSLSVGALSLLTGCNLEDDDAVDRVLSAMSRWNDAAQAALFSRTRLAPTYAETDITDPFPFNAYYTIDQVRVVDGSGWRLELAGAITERRPWTLEELRSLPAESQITRHICIEGWSQIGQWSGVPLGAFLRRVGADLSARYVHFKCFDGYSTSIDMASALQPQTILALDFEEKPLAPQWGAPLRLRIPTKLGFKNAKNLEATEVTNKYPGGYWEDQGYDRFAGV